MFERVILVEGYDCPHANTHTKFKISSTTSFKNPFSHEKDAREVFGTDKRFDEYDNDTHNIP